MKKSLIALLAAGMLCFSGTAYAAESAVEDVPEFSLGGSLFENEGVVNGVIGGAGEQDILGEDAAGLSGNFDTVVLSDDIYIRIPDERNVKLDSDGFYYIYGGAEDQIPYVIFGQYGYVGDDFFSAGLTPLMQKSYPDLSIAQTEQTVMVGDYQLQEVVYNYKISGYTIIDTRLAVAIGDHTVMFGAKEVPELNYYVEDLLLEVISGLNAREPVSNIETIGSIVFSTDIANYSGTWVNFDDSYQLYIPSYWVSYTISDEDKASGAYFRCGNNGGDSIVGSTDLLMQVSKIYTGTGIDLNYIVDNFNERGFSGVALVDVNGIDCVAYEMPEYDLIGFAFFSPAEEGYVITIEGVYDGEGSDAAINMLNCLLVSVSPY